MLVAVVVVVVLGVVVVVVVVVGVPPPRDYTLRLYLKWTIMGKGWGGEFRAEKVVSGGNNSWDVRFGKYRD